MWCNQSNVPIFLFCLMTSNQRDNVSILSNPLVWVMSLQIFYKLHRFYVDETRWRIINLKIAPEQNRTTKTTYTIWRKIFWNIAPREICRYAKHYVWRPRRTHLDDQIKIMASRPGRVVKEQMKARRMTNTFEGRMLLFQLITWCFQSYCCFWWMACSQPGFLTYKYYKT